MSPGTCSRPNIQCVLCALSGFAAPVGRCCLAPVRVRWLWPAACLSGLRCGPAWCAAPRPVRTLSVLWSAFRTPLCLPPPQGLSPPELHGGCAGHAEAGREPGSLYLPLAPAEAGKLGVLRIVPVWGPAMGLSLAGPSGVGIGVYALRWFAYVDPVTDASGIPYGPPFDGGLGRCTGVVSCGRQHLPLRVRGRHARFPCVCVLALLLGWVGRGGLPSGFWCASPFLWPLCTSELLGPLRAGVAPFVSFCLPYFPVFLFFLLPAPPPSLAFSCFRPRVSWALALPAPPRPPPFSSCFPFWPAWLGVPSLPPCFFSSPPSPFLVFFLRFFCLPPPLFFLWVSGCSALCVLLCFRFFLCCAVLF